MERKIDNILNNYYSNDYTEDDRLTKDNRHKVEFITTLKYIDDYFWYGCYFLWHGNFSRSF